MSETTLRIGAVADQAAVNVQTLRYYERRGLLPRPGRTASGYREYPSDTPDVVRFIKRAQELGFTLAEVQELLKLRSAPSRDRSKVRRIALAKMTDIDEKVSRLVAVRQSIAELVECCESGEALRCGIIDALNGECGAVPIPRASRLQAGRDLGRSRIALPVVRSQASSS